MWWLWRRDLGGSGDDDGRFIKSSVGAGMSVVAAMMVGEGAGRWRWMGMAIGGDGECELWWWAWVVAVREGGGGERGCRCAGNLYLMTSKPCTEGLTHIYPPS